jgi:DNA-binding CsgD family transcriptional regulator
MNYASNKHSSVIITNTNRKGHPESGGLSLVPAEEPVDKTFDLGYRKEWLNHMEFLTSVSPKNNAVIFLYDTAVNGFIYMSDPEKILGDYDPKNFISETGQDFYFSNINPKQRTAAILVLLKTFSYGIEHSSLKLNNTVANMTFSYKKKDGNYFQFLQKSMVVERDDAGNPLLYLRFGYDISHLLKPSVGLIINAPDETLIWNYNLEKKCLTQANLLSTHERKILALLSEGRTSKEIADILFVSSHTIDTHRRNLLKKTNCIDCTALITYSKLIGLDKK